MIRDANTLVAELMKNVARDVARRGIVYLHIERVLGFFDSVNAIEVTAGARSSATSTIIARAARG